MTPQFQPLFRSDGRSLVVALDHGLGLNVFPHLSQASRVIDAVVSGGADALLVTPGLLKKYPDSLRSVGTILRVDGGGTELPGPPAHDLICSVEAALNMGADAVACMGFPGTVLEAKTLGNIGRLASQCVAAGLPLMAEMVPGGFKQTDLHTPAAVRLAVRTGIELGADLIKTIFAGPPSEFETVIRHSYRPVLVLGGSKSGERELFSRVREALECGASGAVVGRNVWQHPRPAAMTRALAALIHDDLSVEKALELCQSPAER